MTADGGAPVACVPPFVATAAGCDLVASTSCAAGTKPSLGSESCEPVGHSTCGDGFEADPSGWGCLPILPASACTGATRAALGKKACTPVGTCAWPPPASATAIVVDPSVAEDATHAHTIGGALAKVAAGGTIAIAPGTYNERLSLSVPVTIAGACAADVAIVAPDQSAPGIELAPGATGSTIRGVTLLDHTVAIETGDGVKLGVEDVVIADSRDAGVVAGGRAQVTIKRSVIRGGRPRASDDTRGNAVEVASGGRATVEDSALDDNSEGAVRLELQARATLIRAVVRRTKPLSSGRGGFGIMSLGGAEVVVNDSAFVENAEATVLVERYPANKLLPKVEITGSTISETIPWDEVLDGTGVNYGGWPVLARGSEVTLRKSTIARSRSPSLAIDGGKLTFDEVTARETLPGKEEEPDGVAVQDATFSMSRSAIVGARRSGAFIAGKSVATVDDSLIADVGSTHDAGGGAACEVSAGAALTMRKTALLRFAGYGLRVSQLATVVAGGKATVEDTIIGEGRGYEDGTFGRGVDVTVGEATIRRSLVYGARQIAVLSSGHLTLEQSSVRDTRSSGDGKAGRGVQAQEGGEAIVLDSFLRNNRDVGAFVAHAGSRLRLERTVIEGTHANDRGKLGHGAAAMVDGRLELADCRVLKSAGVGVAVSGAGGVVAGGSIEGNAVGVHVGGGTTLKSEDGEGAPGVLLISPSTVFADNAARVGIGELPLPSASLDAEE